jgi:hypothetical protein
MSYIHWYGESVNNPYPSAQGHIVLAHPLSPDALILAQFQEDPYNRSRVGFPSTDGRSRMGSLRVKGDRYLAQPQWDFNLLCNIAQLTLFEALLDLQTMSPIPITFTDNFGNSGIHTVFVDVDERYATPVTTIDWWKLQFKLSKEL